MMLQLGALFLLGSLSASFALPPCVCTRNLKPVCGSDGQTYGNECMLQCAQLSDPQLFTARSGRCDGTSLAPPRDIRQTRDCTLCTLEYMPICGTDGMTYPNRCSLECAPGPVQLAYPGPCRNRRQTDQSCSCPDELSPVCGTDGSNYGNPCHLNCSKDKHENLEILHVGPCSSSDSIATHECVGCTLKVKPVCGTDGKTYRNPCMLNCEREKDENLHIDYEGPCDPRLQFVESSACGCAPKVQPVCGTNANTYRNKCLLYCAKEKKESIHLDYEGFCKVKQAESFPCTCTRNHKPVCASNGVTFSNECLMKCAGAHLTVAKQGPCEG